MTEIDDATELRSLRDIELFIGLPVQQALQAAIVNQTATWLYNDRMFNFTRNPANNIISTAFTALEHQSTVKISEALRDDLKLWPLRTPVRRKFELSRHRDGVSHPTMIKWRNPAAQKFYDEMKLWKDIRPALIWDAYLSVAERIRELGGAPRYETIIIVVGMGQAVRDITELSTDGELPPVAYFEEAVRRFHGAYLEFIVKYPDGNWTGGDKEADESEETG